MLFTLYQVNAIVEIMCGCFGLVCLLCMLLFANTGSRRAQWYQQSLLLVFVYSMVGSLFDAAASTAHGMLGPASFYINLYGHAFSAAATYLFFGAFTSYLCSRLEGGKQHKVLHIWTVFVWALAAIGSAMVVAGYFFTVDPVTNLYERSCYFWVASFASVFVLVGDLIMLLVFRKHLSGSSSVAFAICILAICGAELIFQRTSVINYVQVAITISQTIIFVDLQGYLAKDVATQRELLAVQDRELMESRVQVMVSQIQPHFLYNTLDSIYYLCGKEPKRAREAISLFSDYLRANLRSLRADKPVPFSMELEHVRNYLTLEQMSSDDTIDFELDVQASDFLLPALSLQPLVENAVKHGLGKQLGGGVVRIETREEPDQYVVRVIDDGVGFDPQADLGDDRPHVGMQNVRQRLETMCGGSLRIESVPGEGTTAIVTIPKEGGVA